MNPRQPDTNGAMDGLAAVLASLARRIETIDVQIRDARHAREMRLDQRTAELIPAIKTKVLESLRKTDRGFVDDAVKRAFRDHDGFFSRLFGTAPYVNALTMLRTRMKKRLEERSFTKTEDDRIARLDLDRSTLAAQQAEAMEMLKLIERAHRSEVPLPRAAVDGIELLASRGRSIPRRPRQNLRGYPTAATGTRPSSAPSSDDDLYIWMMTDIPTSFRTVMLDTLNNHGAASARGGTFAGGGAQGAWSNDAPSQIDAPQQAAERRSGAAGFAAGFVTERMADDERARDRAEDGARTDARGSDGDAGNDDKGADADDPPVNPDGSLRWPAESDPIATDDSLGRFS